MYPFGSVVKDARPDDTSAARVDAIVEADGKRSVHHFWIHGLTKEGGNPVSVPPVLPTVSPFWWIQGAIATDKNAILSYEYMEVVCPIQVTPAATPKNKLANVKVVLGFYALVNDKHALEVGQSVTPPGWCPEDWVHVVP